MSPLYLPYDEAYAEVLQQQGKAHVASGGVWAPAKEIWVASEVTPGVYEWVRGWWAPDIPAGVKPELEQTQFEGGDVEASWANAVGSTDLGIYVEWEINGESFDVVGRPANSTTAALDEEHLSPADQVRARMWYHHEGAEGEKGPWSEVWVYDQGTCYHHGPLGQSTESAQDACEAAPDLEFYTRVAELDEGVYVYSEPGCGTLFSGDGLWVSDGVTWWQFGTGFYIYRIASTGACDVPTTTTTEPPPTTTTEPTCHAHLGLRYSATSAEAACDAEPSVDLYSLCAELAVDCAVFAGSDCTGTPSNGYYSDGDRWWQVASGIITATDLCPGVTTTTTEPPACNDHGTWGFGADAETACQALPTEPLHSPSATLGVGSLVYSNDTCTTAASAGYYSNAEVWHQVSGGEIVAVGDCAPPTTTAPPCHDHGTWGYSAASNSDACEAAPTHPLYSPCEIGMLAGDCAVYSDAVCETPADDGYYADGEVWHQVEGGVITWQGSC